MTPASDVERAGGEVVDDRVHLGADLLAAEQEVAEQRPACGWRGTPRRCRTRAPRSGTPTRTSARGPREVRSEHMSHFIIWSNSATYFGTPNGQASTQFEQPMQRGLSADCTMPSSVCLMASAGQTWAQVGSSQCMHTIGAVCVLVRPVDALEVDQRLAAVGAALHAGLHAGLAADAAALVDDEHRLVVDAERSRRARRAGRGRGHRSVSRRPPARSTRTAATLNSGIFEIGSTARLVSWFAALRAGPVVGDEHGVGPDRVDHVRRQRHRRRAAR